MSYLLTPFEAGGPDTSDETMQGPPVYFFVFVWEGAGPDLLTHRSKTQHDMNSTRNPLFLTKLW